MIWPFSETNNNTHLGIDIGTTSIKIVEIEKLQGAARGRLVNYGALTSNNYIQRRGSNLAHIEGVAIFESEVMEMVKKLLSRFPNHSNEVIMSIPAFSSFVDEVVLPPMPPQEVASAIVFEARSHVPVPISEVELTWQIVRQDDKGVAATIIAVPKEILFRYRSICDQLGLTLKALELETFSIIRALNVYGQEPILTGEARKVLTEDQVLTANGGSRKVLIEDQVLTANGGSRKVLIEDQVLIVDVGARNTNLSVIAKGLLYASHNIETSGRDITTIIAQGLGITARRAEELKQDQGLSLGVSNPGIADALYGAVDTITEEARRFIELKSMTGRLKRLLLTGGSAKMTGLPEYLQKKLGISIDIAFPWSTIECDPKLTAALKANAPSFTVAVGLSLY